MMTNKGVKKKIIWTDRAFLFDLVQAYQEVYNSLNELAKSERTGK